MLSGRRGRTKMKPLVYKKSDKIAYLVMAGYAIIMIIVKFVF